MIGRLLRFAAFMAFVAWFIALRPQALGGPAAWILVAGDSMEPTIRPGSLVVVAQRAGYEVGDVVAYRIPEGNPGVGENVIHRIVGGDERAGYVMRGDNTNGPDMWRPRAAEIVGAAWLTLPGAATLILFLRSPIVLASIAACFAVYVALGLVAPGEPKRARAAHAGTSTASPVAERRTSG